MSPKTDTQALLERAKEEEEKYEWLEAAKSYEQVSHVKSETVSFLAEIWERIGFCRNLASRQTEDSEKFKELEQLAVEAYLNAAKLFEKEGGMKNLGKSAQCNAIAEYVRSWLASDPSEKRKMLDKCLKFGKKSLEAYENTGDDLNFGKTCNELLLCLFERLYVASDWREMRIFAQEGINCANNAIGILSKVGDKSELLRAYFTASLQSWYAANISEQEEERRELMRRSLSYSEEALKLCREVDNPYYVAMSNWAAAYSTLLFTEKVESALEYAQKMLEQGMTVRDNYLKGVASYVLAFVTNWMTLREADPDKKKEGYEKIIKYSENAIRYLQLVSQNFFIAGTYLFYAESYSSLARDIKANLEERRAILKKAVENGRKGLECATVSGSPDAMVGTLHALSKALHFCSNLETEKDEKAELLKEALVHRQEYNKIVERVVPTSDWVRGVGKSYEGLIKADLVKVETDKDKKRFLLESAVSDMEDGVSRCRKSILSSPVPTRIAAVARYEDELGGALNELYLLTEDKRILGKAIDVYKDAAEKFREVNLPSRVAESYWKMAENQDRLGEFEKAAEDFERAFAEYNAAAQRIPHFVGFFQDYATYMKAWSEIERAKFAHKQEEYVAAKENYEEAANLLKQSKLWSYLSSNFLAWAFLEQAEDFSRKESGMESIEAFREASALFKEAKGTLQVQSSKVENEDERDSIERLLKASDTRQTYCLGRIAVEEAKILDSQGEHIAGSEKYGSAAETFNEILESGSEQSRIGLKPLICLCQAWQKMLMAEAKASSRMYGEAAELFKEAKEHTLDERASLLALANSSFCKALEAGTEFEITSEQTAYLTAKRHMEAAANHYLKAGFKTASEYAKATELLFDAYFYMGNAKMETDPERKTVHYAMAEKVLQASAEHYMEAKHREKTEQIHQLLEKVREERDLAVSLSKVLRVPAVTSSTESFAMLTPWEERAVGLERFEGADVQAKLVQDAEEIRVGEDLNLEMQVVNVGKETVQFARLEEIIPAGFQLVAKPDYCGSEDAYLDMKGKRLDPLKTEEIRLVLRPFEKGTFKITPRIVCMDETGNQILRGPDPITINVSEVVLPGRISTGCTDLDNLLYGGIPENYAVVLTSPSCDERDLLIKKFLEKGVRDGQTTFHFTIEASGVRALAEQFQSDFYLFICNPRADAMVKSLPNVFKLKGIENLTNIDITLVSAFRRLDASSKGGVRRACIEIVSDVLLQHHAATTRRWLNGLISDMRSRGFITLAVMNPYMHPSEEVHAILGLFEGEINIYEKETEKGPEKALRIKKMYNQKYLANELPLKKERLEK
jgi:KaiC/GvpD/RAD55 family RecA-like ATPase/tetratricopeptide (TPR) repeat protein